MNQKQYEGPARGWQTPPMEPPAQADPEPPRPSEEMAPYLRAEATERRAEWEARQNSKAQAEREHAELVKLRDDRIMRETFTTLTEAERAEFMQQADPVNVARRMVEKIHAEQAQAFDAQNAATREKELIEYRAKNPYVSQLERHTAIERANARAAQRKAEFDQRRQAMELQAEREGDDITRLLKTLDETGLQQFKKLMKDEPTAAEKMQAVKAGAQARNAQAEQDQLLAAYQAEIAGKRGIEVRLIRQKYYGKGLRNI